MATFRDFLWTFSNDTIEKGRQFEYFVKWFLINDPTWKTQVAQVWRWDEYPNRWGKDLGIDLVFKHKNGDLWSVQAKCYAETTSITKAHIDSFISESSSKTFAGRLLIGTTDRLADNAKKVCDRQNVTRFLLSDFESSPFEFPNHYDELSRIGPAKPPAPRKHQLEAIRAVQEGFKHIDRGQLIMACGTGKTFTTLWIKEALDANSTLILLPSLGLLSQTLHEWTKAASKSFEVLCVCSDDSVGKKGDDESYDSVAQLPFPVTSDPQRIQSFLELQKPKVVFSTYQSSPLVAEAQAAITGIEFDLIVADEAHRCAGVVGDGFSSVLNGQRLRGKKRLFATATPRTYSKQIKSAAEGRGIEVVGMDDEAVFGTPLYTLSFSEAIERKLLTDYRVVIVGVDDAMLASWIENREIVRTDTGIQTDAKSLAATVGLLKAIKDYDLHRLISFHSRVKGAEAFAKEIHEVQAWLPLAVRLKGKLNSDYVSGEMPTDKRRQKLSHLKNVADGEVALLSNARCLSEGVDVPSLDGVAFIDPKNSQIDIIQAVGRAIRLSTNKTAGTIVLPVFIEKGDTAEEVIERSDFKQIWGVMAALKAHDETFANELNQLRMAMGRKGEGFKIEGLDKIVIDLPVTVDASLVYALKAQLVVATTASWDQWFGILLRWREETNQSIPEVADVYEGSKIGVWAATQRTSYTRGNLTADRILKLEELEGWSWDRVEELWESGVNCLVRYWDKYQSSRVPDRYVDPVTGLKLGQWVKTRRLDFSRQKLAQDRIKRLEKFPDWSWDPSGDDWWKMLGEVREALKTSNLAEIERSRKLDSQYAPLAVWIVRQKSCYLAWQSRSADLKSYRRKLSVEEIAALESLHGWSWDRRRDAWIANFDVLQLCLRDMSIEDVIPSTQFNGVKIGRWLTKQRVAFKSGSLEEWKKDKLIGVGWKPNPFDDIWEIRFNLLLLYGMKHGHHTVPQAEVFEGFALGRWVSNQRINFHKGKLSDDRKNRLQALIGWIWDAADNSASSISKKGFSPSKLKKKIEH